SALALNNLGNVLVARSCWVEAAATLERVVQQVPGDANGWINLGHALAGLERDDPARAVYQRALTLRPNDPAAPAGGGAGRGERGSATCCRSVVSPARRSRCTSAR